MQATKRNKAGTKPFVLIVEDEPDIGELIRFHVDRSGFSGDVIPSGKAALDAVRRSPPDLLVLDLMLPDLDGLEICRQLKNEPATRQVPIVIVSARGEEADIVTGLELGADDYVTKPFSPGVLMARIRNVLRRQNSSSTVSDEAGRRISLADGRLTIDLDRHSVTMDGRPIELTFTEFGILNFLASRVGFVRTRDQILSAVHGDHAVLTSRTVDVHVTALRKKLGDLGAMISTVRGVGYRLEDAREDHDDE